MAKLNIKGLDHYVAKIVAMEKSTDAIVKPAIYDGSAVLFKAIKSELEALPTDEVWRNPSQTYPSPKGIKEEQKKGLLDGIGFSTMETKNGITTLRIGFDGYNNLSTSRFPNGEPNAFVARELVLGSSRVPRIDFIKRATKKVKQQAEAEMVKTAEKQIEKIMKK